MFDSVDELIFSIFILFCRSVVVAVFDSVDELIFNIVILFSRSVVVAVFDSVDAHSGKSHSLQPWLSATYG